MTKHQNFFLITKQTAVFKKQHFALPGLLKKSAGAGTEAGAGARARARARARAQAGAGAGAGKSNSVHAYIMKPTGKP